MSNTDDIHSTIGVKQRCPLSPTLFGLYIDDLQGIILHSVGDTGGDISMGFPLLFSVCRRHCSSIPQKCETPKTVGQFDLIL